MKETDRNISHSPRDVMEISNAFRSSSILFAGYKLGIFDFLENKTAGAAEVAEKMNMDRRGTGILLNGLAALGLLSKAKEKFSNSPLSRHYLQKSSPLYVGALVEHNMNSWDKWKKLDSVVKSGSQKQNVKQNNYLRKSRKKTREFILAMEAASLDTARALAGTLTLRKVKKMLDVGGGPGTHTFEIIRKKPDIQAVIMDLPIPLRTTAEMVKKYRMERNVTLLAGDFITDPYGTEYDLVLMSNVLHSNDRKQCAAMIKKAYDALRSGGQLIIKEYVLNEDGISPLQSAIFAVNMLLSTEGGSTYKKSEIDGWLSRAGFTTISSYSLGKYLIECGKKEV